METANQTQERREMGGNVRHSHWTYIYILQGFGLAIHRIFINCSKSML